MRLDVAGPIGGSLERELCVVAGLASKTKELASPIMLKPFQSPFKDKCGILLWCLTRAGTNERPQSAHDIATIVGPHYLDTLNFSLLKQWNAMAVNYLV